MICRSRIAASLAWLALAALTHAAANLTWKEANQRSAELIRTVGPTDEAATLAQQSFLLYSTQSQQYTALNHGQLLLNAVDARLKASSLDKALAVLEDGAKLVAKRSSPREPELVAIWEEGARLSMAGGKHRRAHDFYGRATELATVLLGEDHERTLTLQERWAIDLRTVQGYSWARNELSRARKAAAKADDTTPLVFLLDLDLAKLEAEAKHESAAIERFVALIERLEQATNPPTEHLIQVAYGQLEYLYDVREEVEKAKDLRERRNARLTGPGRQGLLPLLRVSPEYPRKALQSGTQGSVEFMLRIGTDGTVKQANIVNSNPPGVFDSAAQQAIRHWKFESRDREYEGLQRLDFKIDRH